MEILNLNEINNKSLDLIKQIESTIKEEENCRYAGKEYFKKDNKKYFYLGKVKSCFIDSYGKITRDYELKIGITNNPATRIYYYKKDKINFKYLHIWNIDHPKNLESTILEEFRERFWFNTEYFPTDLDRIDADVSDLVDTIEWFIYTSSYKTNGVYGIGKPKMLHNTKKQLKISVEEFNN